MDHPNKNKHLLIAGPDASIESTFSIAKKAFPNRHIEKLLIATNDYYRFDLNSILKFSSEYYNICTSTNEFYLNDVRKELHEKIINLGYTEESIVSPQAHIHEDAIIGEGCIIHSGCFVDAGTKIGKKTLLRPNVSIAEKCNIGDFVTLESNVSVRELTSIDNHTLISANCSVARMVKIGKFCFLNKQQQYNQSIPDYTSISTQFQNPIRSYL